MNRYLRNALLIPLSLLLLSVIPAQAAPTVTLSAELKKAKYHKPTTVVLTATVSGIDPANPVARVEYLANGTLIGSDAAAPYIFTWVDPPAGPYTGIARVMGRDGTVIATSQALTGSVGARPTVTLTQPAEGASFTAPATITLVATAHDPDGSIRRVNFAQGKTLLASDTSAPYTYTWSNVPAGSYVVGAYALDSSGMESAPASVTITVSDTPSPTQVYYLHTDHLDTPRAVTDANQRLVWRNQLLGEPFGNTPPEEDPDGDGQAFTLNLRFPGQYFDKETNTHYNYFRDYDPLTGRYIQSDPIGLLGGINTYGYVEGNPVSNSDFYGLISSIDDCAGKNLPACTEAGIAIPKPSPSAIKEIASRSEVIAKGRDIRKVEELCEKFGGKARDWVKKKGWDRYGNEWHWYENLGRKVGWKPAGTPDPF